MTKSMQVIHALTGGQLETVEAPIPSPQRGQVLIKVHCSPVNPADRLQIAGNYIDNRDPPFIPGVVGVGTVADGSRAGFRGRLVAGRRVVFAPGPNLDGAWAQYALAPAKFCLPLTSDLSDTDGVNLIANGATVFGLIEYARRARAKAIVMTAAAGELGRLLNIAARSLRLPVINVVHREDQMRSLQAEGIELVLNSSEGGFEARLRQMAGKFGEVVAFDCVAGDLTRQLLSALPEGSEIVAVGRLSGQDMKFDGLSLLVGRQMRLSGFNVNLWLPQKSILSVLSIARKSTALLRQGRGTRVQHRVDLDTLADRFEELQRDQSAGKTIVFPNGVPDFEIRR
jgi:NADPH:quinone reductase-like Zn-dependent oxidoreductase